MFESSQDDPICGFGLPVGPRVFDRGKMLLGVEFGKEALETLVAELRVVVPGERLWYPKTGEHVSFVETKNVGRGDFR